MMQQSEVKAQNHPSIMAKRLQRRPLLYGKDQGGCISGLISIFDFRHGRSTKKLIADTSRGSRQANGVESLRIRSDSKVRYQNPKKAKEIKATADAAQTSIKKLMEEEMINEQVPEKQVDVSREGSEVLNSENGSRMSKNHKRRNRNSRNSIDMDICEEDTLRHLEPGNLCQQINEQKSLANVDLETIIKELCQVHHRSTECVDSDLNIDLEMQSDQTFSVVPEKLCAAIKVFMSERLMDDKCSSEHGSAHQSKAFVEALDTINSNKELLLKLLQDPNLLVKPIKGSEGVPLKNEQKSNSLPGSTSLDQVPIKSEPGDPVARKHRKFFHRRSKSQERGHLEGDEICHSSSKIVILKPGPAGSRYLNNENNINASLRSHVSIENKHQSDRNATHFSFSEIKRRLKHAVRKEHHGASSVLDIFSSEHQNRGETEKVIGGENLGWSSPNRNHFYTERFAKPSTGLKRGDKIGKSKDIEVAITNESSGYPEQGVSSIYIEAKKHLSDMLKDGETNAELTKGQLPKSLGRILSLPEYNYSPRCSPDKDNEDSFITARMRLSSSGISQGDKDSTHQHLQEKNDSYIRPSEQIIDEVNTTLKNSHDKGQSPDANCNSGNEVISENSEQETMLSTIDFMTPEGGLKIDETAKTTDQGDEILHDLDTSIKSSPTSEDVHNDNFAVRYEETSSQCLELESFGEDQEQCSPPASPSRSSVDSKNEDLEKVVDRTDRPSPISVLEPLFQEDDISPARTIARQAQLEIHPQKLYFEEHSSSVGDLEISTATCMEDGESPFEYVEAVLLGSGLNWDEFLLRWLSSDQILAPSLFDEVELFSSRRHDQKLLFDCTNEVLKEVCDRYFGFFISTSFSKQSIRSAPRGMNLINEIWEGVEWHLFQQPPPKSLDQLVKKDMMKSRMWKEPHLDIEHISIELEEAIFGELVEDTISSFLDDNPEWFSIDFPAGPPETDISINS